MSNLRIQNRAIPMKQQSVGWHVATTTATLLCLASLSVDAFVAMPSSFSRPVPTFFSSSLASVSSTTEDAIAIAPQVFATGYSTNVNLVEALQEAVQMAVEGLPDLDRPVDFGLVFVSSLYDGGAVQPATTVIPTVLQAVQSKAGVELAELLGCSVAGCVASALDIPQGPVAPTSVVTTEFEGLPAVAVTLAVLPNVRVQTFCVTDVPDDVGRLPASTWQRAVGIPEWVLPKDNQDGQNTYNDAPVMMLLPSPAFTKELDDLLRGFSSYLPTGTITLGSLASTVSSLSRAKVYQYSSQTGASGCYTDACVGAALEGDITVRSFTAQGAKPVGGIYRIVKGQDSTIQVIVLDETATEALALEEENENDDELEEEEDGEDTEPLDAKAQAQQAYAKARIPKPALAEANFILRTLSDDDQAFMRRQLLIGLEQSKSLTASELARLASGQGHRFRVFAVASGGMKDGSVTLPLGSVEITPGTRMRFFVRNSSFAKKELEALWLGYKKRQFNQQLEESDSMWTPTACFIFPTLDRGQKFFMGKAGFESSIAARMLPGTPTIQGFFGNGVIGRWDGAADTSPIGVQGSCSGYFMWGSKSKRPIFNPAEAAIQRAARKEEEAAQVLQEEIQAAEDKKRQQRAKGIAALETKAPRTEDGELVLKRREVHSGRALTVSTVEWSVAEKTATPTSTLEGYMWDKETEVDRFRERVPLANLVSQCRLTQADPAAPKPRDFVGPIKQQAQSGKFVIIPELKRLEPTAGSLRRRYDIAKLARDFTVAGAPALSVNCDGVLFGGSLGDITKVRQISSSAAVETASAEDGVIVPPVLASDLLLYPYQLYKLRLAGTDAVNLLVGALAAKDLLYLSKIAASLQIQTLATCTSDVQLQAIAALPAGSVQGIVVSNRDLEDFSFDMTGQQALNLLKSEALHKAVAKHNLPVLVEGRVGIIEGEDGTPASYVRALREAGAIGAVMGGGLVVEGKTSTEVMKAFELLV